MKKYKLYIPIYGENLTFLISNDTASIIAYINKNKPKGYTNTWIDTVEKSFDGIEGACYVSFEGDCEHYVLLQKKPATTWDLAILNHELLHITHRILGRRNLHLTTDTEEAYTYLQQFMFNEFCKAFKLKKISTT